MTDIALKPRSMGMSTAVAIHFKDDGGMEQIPVERAISKDKLAKALEAFYEEEF
jgi:hypothetical protein